LIFTGRGCGCLTPLLFFVLILLLFLFRIQILAAMGAALVRNDPPEKADAAVVLAGDDSGYRILTAAQLVKDGWVPYALISGMPYFSSNEADLAISYAEAHGYPRSYFRPFERPAVATRDETQAIGDFLKAQRIHKILLVTSNFHTRRAAFLMHQAAPNLEIRAIAAPDKYFRPGDWWKSRGGQRTFLLEWTKTLTAHLGY
jgi:uncharacterized SAM-binding protein YcdF (DUF218 family)